MKCLLIAYLLLIAVPMTAQVANISEIAGDIKRFMFGINVSPDYCYRTMKNNNNSKSSESIIDLRKKYETPLFGYSGGVNVLYLFSKQFSVEAGVQYSKKGYRMKARDLNFGDQVDPRYGFTYNTAVGNSSGLVGFKVRYNHHYLDIPLRAIYTIGEKRMRFTSSIGITTSIPLKATQTSVIEYGDGDTQRTNNDQLYKFNRLNISPTVSVGIDYSISSKFSLRAEPTFRYGLIKISDTPVTAYLWSWGLNISCYYIL